MHSLEHLCNQVEQTGSASFPLLQACALPRTAIDQQPLPLPDLESAFDSSWQALLPEAQTPRA